MKKFTIPVVIEEFRDEELPEDVKKLKAAAEEAREKSYSPYSHFRVGAAVLLEDGTIITANNQENAAYPSGMCAERIAIWYAGAQFPDKKIMKLFITARAEDKILDTPVPPCGACRQSIAEYEIKQDSPIEIWFAAEKGPVWRSPSLKNILPLLFDGSQL